MSCDFLLFQEDILFDTNANQTLVILMLRRRDSIIFKAKSLVDLCKVIVEIYGHSWFAVVKPYIF